jgi:hypothetical protein
MGLVSNILLSDLAHHAAPREAGRVAHDPKVISDHEFLVKHGMSREAYAERDAGWRRQYSRNAPLPTWIPTWKPSPARPTARGTSSRRSAISLTASEPRSRTWSPGVRASRASLTRRQKRRAVSVTP